MNSKIASNDTPKFVARYIENFIDLVENIPNDLSRRITRVHELQLDYESSLNKLESNLTRFSKPTQTASTTPRPQTSSNSNNHTNNKHVKQLKLLLTTQHCLIKMQEISDNKLAIIQDALDQLDGKSRELDYDFKLINAVTSDSLETNNSNSNNSGNSGTSNNNGANNSSSNNSNSNTASGAGAGNNSKAAKNSINNKHQSSSSSTSHHQPKSSQRESPEPTYCVCHQVSYGDMICCDNDACEIEWFHFQCVTLTSKPKGKWFCPNCRGDRSNQPKK